MHSLETVMLRCLDTQRVKYLMKSTKSTTIICNKKLLCTWHENSYASNSLAVNQCFRWGLFFKVLVSYTITMFSVESAHAPHMQKLGRQALNPTKIYACVELYDLLGDSLISYLMVSTCICLYKSKAILSSKLLLCISKLLSSSLL